VSTDLVDSVESQKAAGDLAGGGSSQRRLILGSGRSGTTWVLDCLATANNLRPIFEPLHSGDSALGMRYAYQFVANNDTDDVLRHWFDDLAAGRMHSMWIDYRAPKWVLFPRPSRFLKKGFAGEWLHVWRKMVGDRKQFAGATQFENTLIKCIRANLMAGWMVRKGGFRTALIVRHPCATVESQYRAGWDPTAVLEIYRANNRLHEATDGRYLKLLNSKLTTVQELTLKWVIENQVPVRLSNTDGYAVVYYEDLVMRPESAWPRLCASLDLKQVPDFELQRQPSQQSFFKSADQIQHGQQPNPRWLTHLTSEQLDSIQGMLDATECALYNVSAVEPIRAQ